MAAKKHCPNYNHSRSFITIKYCPQCGEKFNTSAQNYCDDEKHRSRRKERDTYCIDCGKNLKSDTKGW